MIFTLYNWLPIVEADSFSLVQIITKKIDPPCPWCIAYTIARSDDSQRLEKTTKVHIIRLIWGVWATKIAIFWAFIITQPKAIETLELKRGKYMNGLPSVCTKRRRSLIGLCLFPILSP